MKSKVVVIFASLAIVGCTSPMVEWKKVEERGFPPLFYRVGEDTPFTGIIYHLYPDGKIHEEEPCKSGRKTGVYKSWHPNGSLESKVGKVDGVTHGRWLEWHDNGQIAVKTTTTRGAAVGRFQSWSPNGTLTEDTVYAGKTMRRRDPEYLKAVSSDQAAAVLELTMPIDVLDIAGYEDGGSIGCVMLDASGKEFSFVIDGRLRSPTRWHYYLGSSYPSYSRPNISMLPKGNVKETAIKVLLIDWVDRHFSRRRQRQIVEEEDVDIFWSTKERNASYILWLYRTQESEE